MDQATVFNIQKFCINDGPGIRTTVFFKGCPLNCVWCHNPESKQMHTDISFQAERCVGCGQCVPLCPNGCHTVDAQGHLFDRTACVRCGACTKTYCNALEAIGRQETVQSILDEVLKDRVFYENSGGGMTVSGGEPMLQFDFLLQLLKAAKAEGLHTAMETCGYASAEQYLAVLPYVDLFLFDYKETDAALHQQFTGVTNEKILANLHLLDEAGAEIILRCPIIPGLNERPAHFSGIAQTANSLKNCKEIHVEPYHPLGSGKSTQIGVPYALADLVFPSEDTVSAWIAEIQSQTDKTVRKA